MNNRLDFILFIFLSLSFFFSFILDLDKSMIVIQVTKCVTYVTVIVTQSCDTEKILKQITSYSIVSTYTLE